jgi:tetratricopeptide (TPR) repeat protein
MAAIGVRYLAMAAIGFGTAAYQDPEPVGSHLDPWWLAAVTLTPLLLWRIVVTLRHRREEAAWWLGAAAAYAPVSQFTPFAFAMADRYLYFVLPGLLGGALLAGRDLLARIERRSERRACGIRVASLLARGALAAGIALTVVQLLHAQARAVLWRDPKLLVRDSIAQYPNGRVALFEAGAEAASRGDHDRAIELLRAAADRGYYQNQPFWVERLEPLKDDPRYQALLRDIAGQRIAMARERGYHTQRQMLTVANAHCVLGEFDQAIEVLEAAIRDGGPLESKLIDRLLQVRNERAERRLPPAQ